MYTRFLEVGHIDYRFMNYKITDQTLYLRSTQKIGVVTEVVELEQTFYLMQDSLQIIDHSCTCYGSSYQGVVTCVKKLFHLKQNPPLPLDPLQGLYALRHIHLDRQIASGSSRKTSKQLNTASTCRLFTL